MTYDRFRSAVAVPLSRSAGACTSLLVVPSCSSGTNNGSPEAGSAVDGGAASDSPEQSTPAEDGAASTAEANLDGAPANPCVSMAIDASGDPFAGVWKGVQQNETWTYVLNEGTATVTAQNDSCAGSYTVTSSTTATGTLMCVPLTSAGSPAHTDTGTYTLSDGGTTMTYAV